MRLKPDAHNLLATALDLFHAEILPALPPEKRYAALMIANALAMTERELADFPRANTAGLAALYADAADMDPDELERRFAADIEAGRFDEAGPRRNAAFAVVKAINAARLVITNPKRLTSRAV